MDEIVAVCMGPETAQRALQKALALGADRAVLLTDPALAGSDICGTAYALAAVLEKQDADLVILGQQAADADCYVMAAAVADHLRRPLVTQVAHAGAGGGSLRAKRQTEHGYDVIEAPLPAVVSVSDAINTAAAALDQGDHGRQEEADRRALGRRRRPRHARGSAPRAPAAWCASCRRRRPRSRPADRGLGWRLGRRRSSSSWPRGA